MGIDTTNTGKVRAKYELPSRKAVLVFDPPSIYHGAVVEVDLEVPLGVFFWFQSAEPQSIFAKFGDDVLEGWNLTKDGLDIPATGDGMGQIPKGLAEEIIGQWVKAVIQPNVPLSSPINGTIGT